jgi:hypothetical protein
MLLNGLTEYAKSLILLAKKAIKILNRDVGITGGIHGRDESL